MKSVIEKVYDIPVRYVWRDTVNAVGSDQINWVGTNLNINENRIRLALLVAISGVRDEIC